MQENQEQQQTRPILAVEDDPAIGAMLLETITQFTPYPFVLATHSEQALHMVKDVKPMLFILNYHLPMMNGIELYDRLHAIKELEHVPAMMVSAVLPERELQARHIVGIVFFTFPDGAECELVLGRASKFNHIHVGPYKVLLDKKRILEGAVFPWPAVAQAEQVETLRGMLCWFWHDLCHHFITPLARGQMWSAYGGLADLRLSCVNLARLRENFQAAAEGYEKED